MNKNYEEEFNKRTRGAKEENIAEIIEQEEDLKKKSQKGPLKKLWEDIKLMYSLLKDYWDGTYREVPWGTIAAIIATLIYILSPIDLIPDFMPVIGLVDDAFMVGICLKMISSDLEKYKEFKRKQNDFDNNTKGV